MNARHVSGGHARMDRHDVGHRRDVADRAEIGQHVERQALVGGRIDRQRRGGAHADGVAVGLRPRDRQGADRAAGAAAVVHHHGLAEHLAQPSAMTRPITSVEPPAANGTIMVMGFDG